MSAARVLPFRGARPPRAKATKTKAGRPPLERWATGLAMDVSIDLAEVEEASRRDPKPPAPPDPPDPTKP